MSLLKILPAILKIAWVLLLLGAVALAAGYFTDTSWQTYLGMGSLMVGYVIVIFDMVQRKRRREDASGFYFGATLAPLIALVVLVFLGLLGTIVLAIQFAIYGFSGSQVLRLLHFLGVVLAFLVVSGIPGLAIRAKPTTKTQQDED